MWMTVKLLKDKYSLKPVDPAPKVEQEGNYWREQRCPWNFLKHLKKYLNFFSLFYLQGTHCPWVSFSALFGPDVWPAIIDKYI